MKRESICKIPDKFIPAAEKLVNKVFDFELVTPMFGGDADSWEIDAKNPVRSQAVKGMLRFWWRTMQTETDPQKLLYNENKIWGGKIGNNDKEKNRIQSPVKLSVIAQQSKGGVFQG
jgi:CRISPR-associated protein Cmr1